MDANEFWCRAFLAAMKGQYVDHEDGGRWENHGAPAAYCERAADAALAVAQQRGMVTGERRLDAADSSTIAELRDLAQILTDVSVNRAKSAASKAGTDAGARRSAQADGLREAAAVVLQRVGELERAAPRQEAELERVEFKVDSKDGGTWVLSTEMYQSGLLVVEGDEVIKLIDGNTVHIKWDYTVPPRPIEVWIERSAR